MTWYAKNFEDYENVQVAAVDETLESRTLESIRKRERKCRDQEPVQGVQKELISTARCAGLLLEVSQSQ